MSCPPFLTVKVNTVDSDPSYGLVTWYLFMNKEPQHSPSVLAET